MSKVRLDRQGRIDIVRNSSAFDSKWYDSVYRDVRLLGMEPAEHFERFGPLLRRESRPGMPTGFFADAMGSRAKSGADILQAATDGLPSDVETPAILWAASRMVARSGDEAAREIAAKYLPEEMRHLLHVLDASSAARSENLDAWEASFNRYLSTFDLAAVRVDRDAVQETENILAGLRSSAPQIAGGPKVTVLMSAFKAEATIGYAVRSILDQSWTDLELIVVDDASNDRTVAVAERAAAGDPRCRVLRNPVNTGPYASRNAALPLATGDLITCHDADDWAHPQRIERQVSYMRDNGLAFSISGMVRISSAGEVTRFSGKGRNTIDGATTASFVSMIFERRLFSGIYGHWDDIRFGADSEMVRRIGSIENEPMPRQFEPLQFTLDAPGSLTNHPTHGFTPGSAMTPSRRFNRDSASEWHTTEAHRDPWLPFPHAPRRFPAHPESINDESANEMVRFAHAPDEVDRLETCDLLVVTDLGFSGENCSSTIEEVRIVHKAGLNVRLVHCPVPENYASDRVFRYADHYAPFSNLITDWVDLKRVHARRLLIRHPQVVASPVFERIVGAISADRADIIINGGAHHETGGRVYDIPHIENVSRRISAKVVRIAPIGPLVRHEIEAVISPDLLAAEDWNPTFDVSSYSLLPKATLEAPFTVGHHVHDGAEDCPSDYNESLALYPTGPNFVIRLLGGARSVEHVSGEVPSNWAVCPSGSISRVNFLAHLDVFVYFHSGSMNEALSRAVIEAMIAARPVILPHRFGELYGYLAYYSGPEDLDQSVRRMAEDWDIERVRLLRVKKEVMARFSSSALIKRFPEFEISGDVWAQE